MKNDIYKELSTARTPEQKQADRIGKMETEIRSVLAKIENQDKTIIAPVLNMQAPEVQKVEVQNPTEMPSFPDVQKVEVQNPIEIPAVEFPDIQKVEVTNPPEPEPIVFPEVQKVEVTNPEPVVFPRVQKVEVQNPTVFDIPIGKADKPGDADPERYVPVRLTNGKKFYHALSEAYTGAAKSAFPFVDQNGKPKAVTLNADGTLPTVAGGATVTTSSGSPLYVFPVNIPTTQSVFVTNPSSTTVTTTSGSPLDVTVRNIPTVQTVNVQNLPATTTISGIAFVQGDIASLQPDSSNPVKVGGSRRATLPVYPDGVRSAFHVDENGGLIVRNYMPVTISGTSSVTSTSGTQHATIDNYPTVQTVSVANFPTTQPVSATQTGTWTVQPGNTANTTPWIMSASNETATVYNGTTALTPKFATIVASASGVTNVLALVSSKRIRVLQVVLIANAAVNVKFQSHVTPTDITGLFYLAANTGFSSGYSPTGQFQTVSGEALDINLSAAVAVGGYLTYVEV